MSVARLIGLAVLLSTSALGETFYAESACMEQGWLNPLLLDVGPSPPCQPIQPLKRISGEDPKWPQPPGPPQGARFQVRCFVTTDGRPRQCRATGPTRFQELVLAAVNTWTFEPFHRKGAVEPQVITYVFSVRMEQDPTPSKPEARDGGG